jgi:periplasmic divalent cation tolerance protein
MVDARGYSLMLCTTGSDAQADAIARALVEERLAACVNIVGSVCSVYRWKGSVTRDEEKLLLIKTAADRVERVRERIRELHTYEVPEILALPLGQSDPDYLGWLESSLREGLREGS